jgi:hypothetical protein
MIRDVSGCIRNDTGQMVVDSTVIRGHTQQIMAELCYLRDQLTGTMLEASHYIDMWMRCAYAASVSASIPGLAPGSTSPPVSGLAGDS